MGKILTPEQRQQCHLSVISPNTFLGPATANQPSHDAALVFLGRGSGAGAVDGSVDSSLGRYKLKVPENFWVLSVRNIQISRTIPSLNIDNRNTIKFR